MYYIERARTMIRTYNMLKEISKQNRVLSYNSINIYGVNDSLKYSKCKVFRVYKCRPHFQEMKLGMVHLSESNLILSKDTFR